MPPLQMPEILTTMEMVQTAEDEALGTSVYRPRLAGCCRQWATLVGTLRCKWIHGSARGTRRYVGRTSTKAKCVAKVKTTHARATGAQYSAHRKGSHCWAVYNWRGSNRKTNAQTCHFKMSKVTAPAPDTVMEQLEVDAGAVIEGKRGYSSYSRSSYGRSVRRVNRKRRGGCCCQWATLLGNLHCKWVAGHPRASRTVRLGSTSSKSKCVARVKERHPHANGAQYSAHRKGRQCRAVYGWRGANGSHSSQTCHFKVLSVKRREAQPLF